MLQTLAASTAHRLPEGWDDHSARLRGKGRALRIRNIGALIIRILFLGPIVL